MAILRYFCGTCGCETYTKTGLTSPNCIVCGRRNDVSGMELEAIVSDPGNDGARTGSSKDASLRDGPDVAMYKVGFFYEHHGEYDYGCQIIIDGKEQLFASTNDAAFVRLSEGNHNVAVKVHVSAGVNSTDAMTSLNLNVTSDCNYLIHGQGLFRRQVIIERYGGK